MASYEPIFEPGLKQVPYKSVRQDLVDSFPNSQTRGIIYQELCTFISHVSTIYAPCELWVDGSFVTKKENPNDVDILVILNFNDFCSCCTQDTIIEAFRKKYTLVDSYFWIDVEDESVQQLSPDDKQNLVKTIEYWKRQYGFDREERPKGIAILNSAELIKLIEKEG